MSRICFCNLFTGQGAIEHDEIVGVDHLVVPLENARLEEAETFGAIIGQAEVHARFVIFQLGAAAENAVDGDVERRAEIKSDVRHWREAVEIAQPARRAAAGGVARKRGVNVAVGQDEIVALQQRHDLAFAAVGKVGGVQQRKCRRRQQAALLSASRRGLHQRRRIPLGEMQAVAADFEPALQQIKLRAFARAVGAFDDDKRAGIRAAGNGTSRLRQRGFDGFGAGLL